MQNPHDLYDYEYGLKDEDISNLLKISNPLRNVPHSVNWHSAFDDVYFAGVRCKHYIRNDYARIKIKIQGFGMLRVITGRIGSGNSKYPRVTE